MLQRDSSHSTVSDTVGWSKPKTIEWSGGAINIFNQVAMGSLLNKYRRTMSWQSKIPLDGADSSLRSISSLPSNQLWVYLLRALYWWSWLLKSDSEQRTGTETLPHFLHGHSTQHIRILLVCKANVPEAAQVSRKDFSSSHCTQFEVVQSQNVVRMPQWSPRTRSPQNHFGFARTTMLFCWLGKTLTQGGKTRKGFPFLLRPLKAAMKVPVFPSRVYGILHGICYLMDTAWGKTNIRDFVSRPSFPKQCFAFKDTWWVYHWRQSRTLLHLAALKVHQCHSSSITKEWSQEFWAAFL